MRGLRSSGGIPFPLTTQFDAKLVKQLFFETKTRFEIDICFPYSLKSYDAVLLLIGSYCYDCNCLL